MAEIQSTAAASAKVQHSAEQVAQLQLQLDQMAVQTSAKIEQVIQQHTVHCEDPAELHQAAQSEL